MRCNADGRPGLKQLCCTIMRLDFANERVQTNAAGHGVLKRQTPWRNGTKHPRQPPLEYMRRLAARVPRPRLHLIRSVSAQLRAAK